MPQSQRLGAKVNWVACQHDGVRLATQQLVNVPVHCGHLHLGANHRNQLAYPQEAEVTEPKCGKAAVLGVLF